MDSLLNRARVRLSGQENPNQTQKASSIEEEKGPKSWIKRIFSKQMSQEYDSSEAEEVIAVAAAAFAITSVEESSDDEQEKWSTCPEHFLTGIDSQKKERPAPVFEPFIVHEQFSGEGSTTSLKPRNSVSKFPEHENVETAVKTPRVPEPSLTRIKSQKKERPVRILEPAIVHEEFSGESSTRSRKNVETPVQTARVAPQPDEPIPEMIKFPTFPDKRLDGRTDIEHKTLEPKTRQSGQKSEIEEHEPDEPKMQSSTGPGREETGADAWEKAKFAKIQKRYEELNDRIISWENKNKTKARNQLHKREQSDSDQKRLKAFEKFRNKMDDIDQIVGGARSKAIERKRNEELKAKEKANRIRQTGKLHGTCFCC